MNEIKKDISNQELLEFIIKAREGNKDVIVLTGDEVVDLRKLLLNKDVLYQMAEDRKAFGRVFTWALYLIASAVALITGWVTIGNHFGKIIKGS